MPSICRSLLVLSLAALAAGCASRSGFRSPDGARSWRSEHFRMESGVSPETSRRILDVSEQAWSVFAALTGEPPSTGAPVGIYVFATGEEFSRAVPPGAGERTAAAFVPSQNVLGFACDERAVERTLPWLRHELLHAWMHGFTAGHRLPEFLSEGPAYYVTWCDWPPADDRPGAEEAAMVVELEMMAWLGHAPSLAEVLAEPTSMSANARAGEFGTRDYHAIAAFLMRMILLDPQFRGFLPKLLSRYAASGPMTGGESCDLFTKTAAEFLGDPAALETRFEETMAVLRVRAYARTAETAEQLQLFLHSTTLVPMRDGQRVDPGTLTPGLLREGKGLTLVRDPERALPLTAEAAIRKGRELGRRIEGTDPATAPEELAAEVTGAAKALRDFESTIEDLQKLMGEAGFMQLERAATAPGSTGKELRNLHIDSQLARIPLEGWLSRRGGK